MRAKEDDKTRETIHELNKQKIHYQKLEKKDHNHLLALFLISYIKYFQA